MKILIILIAIAGTAAGAFHTYTTRNQFIEAALLSEAYTLTAPLKLRVADYYLQNSVMPHNNAAAGIAAPQAIFGSSVKRVAVNRGGVLRVDFDEEIGKADMVFTPIASADKGFFSWRCTSDSLDPALLEKLRPSCSHLPSTQESKLMKAIANSDLEKLKAAIGADADVNAVTNGNTPLMLAARIGNTDVVKVLIDHGADIDHLGVNRDRRSPLMVAITSNRAEAATVLLSRGASVLRTDYQDKSALDHAKDTDLRLGGERYELIVAARLNPNFAGNQESNLDTVVAEQALDAKLSNALLLCDSLNVRTTLRDNPGVDVSESAIGSRSYLELAFDSGCADIASELIRDHSLAGTLNPELLTGVIQGERHDRLLQMVGSLIEAGVDVNAKSSAGETALAASISAEQPVIAKYLIDAGADVNERSGLGSYPIIEASKKGYQNLVSQLVSAGADVDVADSLGRSAIIAAVAQGKTQLVETLLQAGANPHKRDNNGISARILAESSGKRSIQSLITATASR